MPQPGLLALALLVACNGARLDTADAGPPAPAVADTAVPAPSDAGGVGILSPPPIRPPVVVLEDAGAVDAGPVPECAQDGDCTAPLPPVRCSTANNLRAVTGRYCAGGACAETSLNTWCAAGCETGACVL